MRLKKCVYHGYWDTVTYVECPRCNFLHEDQIEEKTFLGLNHVGWVIFIYISALVAGMAWIVTAHAGGDDFTFPLTPGTCQPHTSYDQQGWTIVEYTDLLKKAKEKSDGKVIMKQFPSLVCQ